MSKIIYVFDGNTAFSDRSISDWYSHKIQEEYEDLELDKENLIQECYNMSLEENTSWVL